ncbi:MAG: hypothetical protein AAF432_11365 [Planctomycetota bacterium]
MTIDLTIRPDCASILEHLSNPPSGTLFGHPLADWRTKTRLELGLDTDRPILATGHQALLWHPGILAKYLLVDAVTRSGRFASANLVVDQHAGGYADLLIPVQRADGSLAERMLQLTTTPKDVPMGMHYAFTPPRPPQQLSAALPSVQTGVERICSAIYVHRDAPNAAIQMSEALSDLMEPWVARMPNVTASDLVESTLSRRMLEAMVEDPWAMAESYNRAVRAFSHIGVATLLIRDDYVELPLWRVRDDGRRMHAYDSDVQAYLDGRDNAPRLMPRALYMTALIRLAMCDVFVHGTGGANYDRAMERWLQDWLGVQPSEIAVATSTLQLPLRDESEPVPDVNALRRDVRRLWHNPEQDPSSRLPGEKKSSYLSMIANEPRNSPRRREAFFEMHRELGTLRQTFGSRLNAARTRAVAGERAASDAAIAARRSWAFPLYPEAFINELADVVRDHVSCSTS